MPKEPTECQEFSWSKLGKKLINKINEVLDYKLKNNILIPYGKGP